MRADDPVGVSDDPGWQLIEEIPKCETPWLRVIEEVVATPTRSAGCRWTVARRPKAAVIAPRFPDGTWLLIRQERIAVRRTMWEFPAGQVEGRVTPESIRATALRELREEAGVEPDGALIELGAFFSSCGFTDECMFLFLADCVRASLEGATPDHDEAILETRRVGDSELWEMIATGEICDANTLAITARLVARGLIRPAVGV